LEEKRIYATRTVGTCPIGLPIVIKILRILKNVTRDIGVEDA